MSVPAGAARRGSDPAVVALDDTHFHKSGRKVSGAKYRRDPLGPSIQVSFIGAQRLQLLILRRSLSA